MKKAIWLSLTAVASVITVATGASLALFRSNVVSESQTFTAAKVCLSSKRDGSDNFPGPMFYVTPEQGRTAPAPVGSPGLRPTWDWAPGDANERTLIVKNECLPVWLESVRATLVDGDEALAEKLQVVIKTEMPYTLGDRQIATGTLKQFLDGDMPLQYDMDCPSVVGDPFPCGTSTKRKVPMSSPNELYVHFTISLPTSLGDVPADNLAFQGKSLKVHFAVNAVQQAGNP